MKHSFKIYFTKFKKYIQNIKISSDFLSQVSTLGWVKATACYNFHLYLDYTLQ